jgi:hypothetical protein
MYGFRTRAILETGQQECSVEQGSSTPTAGKVPGPTSTLTLSIEPTYLVKHLGLGL